MTTQGIEARSGETGTGSTEGESPSGKAGAPKLDWTAPLMLDDGKGTGVGMFAGPDLDGWYCVSGYGWYRSDGTPIHNSTLPRIINRPKPDAEPVAIDWTKPIEHVDGTPLVFDDRESNPDAAGDYYLVREDGEALSSEQTGANYTGKMIVCPNGRGWDHHDTGAPLVRNRIAQPVDQLPADEPDTVTVLRMTAQEFNHRFMLRALTPIAVAVELGLIKPDTPLDRFTASHPNWRDLPVEEAVRLALEQRGEG